MAQYVNWQALQPEAKGFKLAQVEVYEREGRKYVRGLLEFPLEAFALRAKEMDPVNGKEDSKKRSNFKHGRFDNIAIVSPVQLTSPTSGESCLMTLAVTGWMAPPKNAALSGYDLADAPSEVKAAAAQLASLLQGYAKGAKKPQATPATVPVAAIPVVTDGTAETPAFAGGTEDEDVDSVSSFITEESDASQE